MGRMEIQMKWTIGQKKGVLRNIKGKGLIEDSFIWNEINEKCKLR